MTKDEIKRFVYVTAGLVAVIWVGILYFSGSAVSGYRALIALNTATGAVVAIWTGYFKFLWRVPYFRRVLYRPNINGTWLGQFKSDWTDEEGQGVPPGAFVLVVRQSFFRLAVHAFTAKQTTVSYVEMLVLNAERGTKKVAYLYDERRASAGSHGARQGAAELDLIEERTSRLLQGGFWTHGRTSGFVKVLQASAKRRVESLSDARSRWPDRRLWADVQ